MDKIAEIEIRKSDKLQYFRIPADLNIEQGTFCIVKFIQGTVDYGKIYRFIDRKKPFSTLTTSGKVIRKITEADEIVIQNNIAKKREAFDICKEKIKEHKLPMKLIDVEYSFDKTKITFYYWADGRIDFRNIVKDLARIFNCRIEMRQIGLRDEAKVKGGCGICGQPLCCARFLKNFDSITMRMVKNQKLPLDMNKITGLCGRLLCCLQYEEDSYKKKKKVKIIKK
jgi:cell fate regulator YaaT (PSP1 superfamily)